MAFVLRVQMIAGRGMVSAMPSHVHLCTRCNEPFAQRKSFQRFCSRSCQLSAYRARVRLALSLLDPDRRPAELGARAAELALPQSAAAPTPRHTTNALRTSSCDFGVD